MRPHKAVFLTSASRYALVLLLATSAVLKIHFLGNGADHLSGLSRSIYAVVAVFEVALSVLLLTRFAVPIATMLIAGVTGAALVTALYALHGQGAAECHCLGRSKISIWQSLALQGLLLFLSSVWLLGRVRSEDSLHGGPC